MSRLLDSDPAVVDGVRPDEYFFRIFVEMETGDPELAGVVNGGMWVGSAARRGEEGEELSFWGGGCSEQRGSVNVEGDGDVCWGSVAGG